MHKRYKDFTLGNPNERKPGKLPSKEINPNFKYNTNYEDQALAQECVLLQQETLADLERDRNNKIAPKITSSDLHLSSLRNVHQLREMSLLECVK